MMNHQHRPRVVNASISARLSGCSVKQSTNPISGGDRMVVVRPDEPEHRPTRHLAQFILAALLPKDRVSGGFTGLEKSSVFHAAVELSENPMVAPSPVGD